MNHYFYIKFIAVLLLCFNLNVSLAQYPHYNHYNIENLLPTNEIYAVFQDHKGYIWVGSDLGLFKFDGKKFIKYTSSQLKSNSATGICESKDGKIFAYNFSNQLFYIENEKLKVVPHIKYSINNLDFAKNGYLWMTTSAGVFKINPVNFKITEGVSFKKHQMFGGDAFTTLIRSCGKETYFLYKDYVVKINANQKESRFKIPNFQFSSPVIISKSNLRPWFFKMNGESIYKIEGKHLKEIQNSALKKLIFGKKITNVVETSPNEIWICTFSGIIYFNKKTHETSLFYPQYAFSNIIKDKNHQYWLSTLNNGVLHIPFLNQKTWNLETQAISNEQITHLINSNENIVAGASGGEIYQMNKSNFEIKKFKLPIQSDFGFLNYNQSNNAINFNLTSQLFELKNNQIKRLNAVFRPAKDIFFANKKYIIASSQGTYILKNLSDTNQVNPIEPSWGRNILKHTEHLYFIASNNGIILLNTANEKAKIIRRIKANTQFFSLIKHKNIIYALDFKGNIYKLSSDFKIKKVISLASEQRFTKMYHYKHYLVLSSNQGVYFYDLIAKKNIKIQKENGLISNNIKDFLIENNHLWIATSNGYQKIHLSILNQLNAKSKLYIKQIYSKQRNFHTAPFTLDNKEDLTIKWNALSYHSFGKHQVLYRLNQQEWNLIQANQDQLHFDNLPNGENILEIKIIDINGNEGVNAIVLHFAVEPPFYQKWWFYLLLMAFVAIVSFLIYKKRINVLEKKQRKELEKIQLESDLRWSQQNALKAQMNPHFLFNILNSIKGYIYENDKLNAIKYLSDFSSLVRDVLELSSLSYVSLEKELQFIKVYIELEAMLLDDVFEYEINVDERIDTSFVQIPSLLIQPFIENAFKHGLRHSKTEKKLIIKFELNEDQSEISINIIDNGIGRDTSIEINKLSDKRTSFATNAINQRIRLLNQENENNIQLKIIDLFDENSKSTGTLIAIKITLIK